MPAGETPAKPFGDLQVPERAAKWERRSVLKHKVKMLAFWFVLFVNFTFQILNHKETEAEAFDTDFGFKEITFCLLC